NIFQFGDTPAPSHFNFYFAPSLFYTRRIGRAPQGVVNADFVDMPAETSILGAAKLTGKLPNGVAVGVLDALTDVERARFVTGSDFGRQQVEPMTNYFVSRMTKEIGSTSRVGFMLTSTDRRLPDDLSSTLRKSAQSGGVDGYTSFLNKSWILESSLFGSRVSGSEAAIEATQESPARYFQRPDAKSFHLDPFRTSLEGWGGKLMMSKADGVWRPILAVQANSPGLETNDIGFMQRTDIVETQLIMQYVDQVPRGAFRERNMWTGVWENRNFDGDVFERGVFGQWFGTTQNYLHPNVSLFLVSGAWNDRLTRGGPVVRNAPGYSSDMSFGTDDRKPLSAVLAAHADGSRDSSYSRFIDLTLTARPRSNLQLSIEPNLSRSHDPSQYITTFADPGATRTFGNRYVFSHLEQRSFQIGTRADWTLTPRLSFQLYLQPFIASGDFHNYRELVAARTRDYAPVAAIGSNPDFNFRSVRGSAVVRWEFRPGSALFLAWNENRAVVAPIGDFRFGRDLRA
ncbi:MAG TPA: DUF5916 domain-containing protein, partial [Thermoanaerobaculia bacterium]